MRDLYRGDGGRLSSYDEGWNDGVEAAMTALSSERDAAVAADDRLAYLEEAYQSAMRVGSEAQRRAEEAVAERDAAVVANCPRMCDDFCNEYQTVLRAEKAEAANVGLVGAIDMIRETLNGSNVQDLLLIINGALDEARNV